MRAIKVHERIGIAFRLIDIVCDMDEKKVRESISVIIDRNIKNKVKVLETQKICYIVRRAYLRIVHQHLANEKVFGNIEVDSKREKGSNTGLNSSRS